MKYMTTQPSPLGALTLASDGEHLTGLWLEGQAYFGAGLNASAKVEALPVFEEAAVWLASYFSGAAPAIPAFIKPAGTPFQTMVWQALCAIPYGETRTYGALAAQLGSGSPRAVGSAVGRNPISIIIPCHRVLGAGGSLTGYAGGLARKEALLTLEGIIFSKT